MWKHFFSFNLVEGWSYCVNEAVKFRIISQYLAIPQAVSLLAWHSHCQNKQSWRFFSRNNLWIVYFFYISRLTRTAASLRQDEAVASSAVFTSKFVFKKWKNSVRWRHNPQKTFAIKSWEIYSVDMSELSEKMQSVMEAVYSIEKYNASVENIVFQSCK